MGSTMTAEEIKKLIRNVPDFPKPGIMFRDFTPLIGDARGFAAVVDQLAQPYVGKVDVVLGIESRGFIIGAPMAYRLGVGFAIARKPGKLPSNTVDQAYDLEYGSASLQMHQDALEGLGRVLLVDDLLATGGTAAAALQLVQKIGGNVIGCAFVIELDGGYLTGSLALLSDAVHMLRHRSVVPGPADAVDIDAARIVGENLRLSSRGNPRCVAQRPFSLAAGGLHLDRSGRAAAKPPFSFRAGRDGGRDRRNRREHLLRVDDLDRTGRRLRAWDGDARGVRARRLRSRWLGRRARFGRAQLLHRMDAGRSRGEHIDRRPGAVRFLGSGARGRGHPDGIGAVAY